MNDKKECFKCNLRTIQNDIEKYSPYPEKVRLVAVSKEQTPGDVRVMYELGIRDFGENRVQGLKRKQRALSDVKDINWHFIGHLQTNKIKHILGRVVLLQSVDRIILAEKMQERAERDDCILPCLIQLNVAREEQKFGIYPEEVAGFLRVVTKFSRLKWRGIMTMAPYTNDMGFCYELFCQTKYLFEQVKKELSSDYCFNILSMGMSNDYIPALRAGSTMLRIGSRLFKEDVSHN